MLRFHALLAACCCVLAATAAALAGELPVRKPGQWRLTAVSGADGMRTFETCITADDPVVTGASDKSCRTSEVKTLGDERYVDVDCRTDAGTEKISTVLTGDFKTWYRAMSKITFDPPQNGVAHLGVTIDGKYLGDQCSQAAPSGNSADANASK